MQTSRLIDTGICITPQQELLVKTILSTSPEQQRQYFQSWLQQVDLDTIDGGSYRLMPMLYKNISKSSLESDLNGRLKGIYRYSFYFNQMLFHQAHRIIDQLNKAGIRVLLLKGAAITLQYYQDYGIRPMGDIDILVDRANVAAAVKIIEENSWTKKIDIELKEAMRTWHSIDFSNKLGYGFDLHWYTMHQCCWETIDADIWDHAREVNYQGLLVYVCDPADMILQACTHGIIWGEVTPIWWIMDVITILEGENRNIDWQRLIQQARQRKLVLTLRACFTCIEKYIPGLIPAGIMKTILTEEIDPEESQLFTLLTSPPGFLNLRLKWALHSNINREKMLSQKIIGFPAYLRNLWGLNSYSQFPHYILSKMMEKTRAF